MTRTETGTRARWRSPFRAMALGVVVVLVSLLAPAAPAGSEAPSGEAGPILLFARTDWTRNGANKTLDGVQMRTRGFYPDACVLAPLPCLTQPEDTATTHVLRALALAHPSIPTPKVPPDPAGALVQLFDKVHWQLGPSGGWRTDILVDDGDNPTILEVKRWGSATTTPDEVDLELDNDDPDLNPPKGLGYMQKFANEVGLTVFRNRELNVDDWLQAYLDDGFGISCVWADPDESAHPGNIYFAPIHEAPADVQLRCAKDSLGKILVIRGLGKIAIELVELLVEAWKRPVVDPPVQITNDCWANYSVSIERAPDRPTTLLMEYGDGVSDTRTVSQGTGVHTEQFSHEFTYNSFDSLASESGSAAMSSCGLSSGAVNSSETSSTAQTSGPYVKEHRQRATILETQAFGESLTVHYVPEGYRVDAPDIAPETQITDSSRQASWMVTVSEDPAAQTTLRMEFGDGTHQDQLIPQGSGEEALSFQHIFERHGAYLQQARVVGSSATGTAATYASPTVSSRACGVEGGVNEHPCP